MPKNPHADFTPTLAGYSGITPFRFWCQTALPLTYDDSLSYYELLNKVVNYLNHTIEDLTNVENNTSELAEAYEKLQEYVNDYFDDIDIEAELRNVLDGMAEDGTLDALLNPLVENQLPGVVDEKIDGVVAEQIDSAVAGQIDESVADQLPALVDAGIPEEVSGWLTENVNPVGSAVMVDSSLTISGAAADAKVTGDEVSNLKTQINTLREMGLIAVPITMELHGITEDTGVDNNNSNYIRTKGFVTLDGLVTFVKKENSIAYIFTYDSQGNFESPAKYLNASTNSCQFTASATKKYRVSFGNYPLETINDFVGDEFSFYQSKDEFARKQDVSDIQNDVDELTDTINGETILLADNFVRGDWEINNGIMVYKPNHTWRITTEQYVTYDRDITFTIDSGYRIYGTMVNESYGRTGNTGWITGEYTVHPHINYLFVIAKVNEDSSVAADITAFSQAVHSKDLSLSERINAIEAKEEKAYSTVKWNDEYYDGHTIRRCYNPYKNGGNNVYVGQLHCHTVGTGSGETQYATPDELCAIYKTNGYDFMTITDYGFITTYGGKSAHPTTVPTDFLWLTDSQEISIPSGDGRAIKHMCVYNAEDRITFATYASIQEVVDSLTPHGYIVSLAHPMWSHTYLTPAQIKADTKFGLRFVEVYDGLTHSDNEEVYPSGMSTDFAWQTLLDSKVYPWGIAISDSHPISNSDIVNGCVKVFADALTRTNIMKNLCEGNFYASTNVSASLTGIDFTDGVLTVNTGDNSATTTFMKENGTVVKTVTGGTASYSLSGNEQYVRAVVELQSGEKIWTQPIINIIDNEYGYYN